MKLFALELKPRQHQDHRRNEIISARMRNISIKKKIPIFIMVAIAIAVLSTVGTALAFFVNYSTNVAEVNVTKAMDGLTANLNDYKTQAMNNASVFATQPDVTKAVVDRNTAEILRVLTPLSKRAGIDFVTVTDENGIVLARTHEPSNKGDSVANQLNVRMAMKGTPFAAIEQGTAVKLSARAGVPVKQAGKVIGVVSTGYKLDKPEVVDGIKQVFKTDATIFLGDVRIATTIIKDGQRAIGTKLDPRIAKIVLKEKRKYTGSANILGLPYLTAYTPLIGADGKPQGVLFTGESVAEIRKTNLGMIFTVIIITLIFTIGVYWITIFFLNKSIINPLANAVGILKQLASGDLNVRIPDDHIAGDETGQLMASIKEMTEHFRKLVTEIHRLGETVAASSEEMMASSEEVSKVAEHVAIAAGDLANGAGDQACATEKGNSNVQKVVQGLNQIMSEMNESDNLAATAKQTVDEGRRAVAYQEMKMDENKTITQQISGSVMGLAKMSGEIGKILEVIRGIAKQTNLLALNAGIEAARAQEHGRGFAVVAEQVKTLSAESSNSVEKIGQIIQEVKNAIDTIVIQIHQAESVVDEQEQSLNQAVNSFNHIAEAVNTISGKLKTVTKATDDLAVYAGQTGELISETAGITQETAAGAEELSSSAEQQSAVVQQIATSLEDLSKTAMELLSSIQRFSV